jgi:Sulfatase
VRSRRAKPFTRSTLVDALHLTVLSSLAIAQPLFDLLGKNAEFFAAHDSGARDILVFAFALLLLPPLGLLLVELLVGLVDERGRAVVHALFVGALTALFVVQALKKRTELATGRWVLCAVVVTVAAALAYWRFRPARLFLSVLGPAPLLFLILFLFFSPVESFITPSHAKAASSRVANDVPVVVVIFDEFPITSLMNGSHRIDAGRYPNFARLARDSTWFRNDSTVHEGTAGAVPAIMTGIYPRRHTYPIYRYHPDNLFTLLGGSYTIEASETITHLCPVELCRNPLLDHSFRGRLSTLSSDAAVVYAHLVVPDDYERRIPSLALSWAHFRGKAAREIGRIGQFERFLDSLGHGGRRSLTLIHILMPHVPWVLLPSCRQYADALPVAAGLVGRDTWADNWLVVQAFQRHLLQVQCTDRLIGRLLARMKADGIYDRSLLIVTADHGVSLKFGEHRRALTPMNAGDIAFPPLFVKRPGQHHAQIVDRHVQSIDIVPTIADVLGVRIPWHVDGVSLFRAGHPRNVRIMTAGNVFVLPAEFLLKMREQTLRRQLRLFGSGDEARLYAIGPHPELIGRAVNRLRVAPAPPRTVASVSKELDGLLRHLPRKPKVVPTPIVGGIRGPGIGAGTSIAVAVNGRIAAVSPTYRSGSSWGYSALAPESAFRPGANKVDVLLVNGRRGALLLRRVGGFP